MATSSSSRKHRIKRVDRISGLPDHLLCHILAFLTTRSAVATSLLSRRWEYVWTGVPVLNFTYGYREIVPDYQSIEAKWQYRRLKYFMDRVLLHSRAVCLERVDFDVLPVMRKKDRLEWFKVLSKRSIKEVNLVYDQCCCLPMMPLLDGSIREHLVALRLHCMGTYVLTVAITSMLHLPRLEIVHLSGVRINDDGEPLSSLFRGSPCLKELVLSQCVGSAMNLHCSTLKTLKFLSPELAKASIRVPNLEYFELSIDDEDYGAVDKCQYLTDDVPCLVEAMFENCGMRTAVWDNHFHRVRHTINLNVAFTRFRDENTTMHLKLPYFERLKCLEVRCYEEDSILRTRMLLRHMPNCVSLKVHMYSQWSGSIERLNRWSEKDSLGLGINMEYIVINGIGRSIENIELGRYLLVCCTGLKEMKLCLSEMLTSKQKNLFRKMTMKFPRPLSCKIIIQDPQDSLRYYVPRVRKYIWDRNIFD